jgi:hypothetical protein
MNEGTIVRKIIKAVKVNYPKAYVCKISDRFTRGLLDILIVVPCKFDWSYREEKIRSRVLFVETKTVKGRLSKIQEQTIQEICKSGAEAIVASDVETVLEKLKMMGALS